MISSLPTKLMPRNKNRLSVCLFARGGSTINHKEDQYHWALMIGPKNESLQGFGTLFHVKQVPGLDNKNWKFEERQICLSATRMILIRVVIGKVIKRERLTSLLRNVPLRGHTRGWNCVLWVKEALQMIELDGRVLGTRVTDWERVSLASMWYCERKKAEHRFDGKAVFDQLRVPTWNLLLNREMVV